MLDKPWLIIVLLGAVIFAYAWLKWKTGKSGRTSASPDVLQEIRDSFTLFASDFEEENRKLLERLQSMRELYGQRLEQLAQRVERLEKQLASLQEVQGASPAAESTGISARYRHILSLYEQGKSIDYIARHTRMNKGEVQLIVTLAKREAAAGEQE